MLCLCLSACGDNGREPPSDRALIDNFVKNRKLYEDAVAILISTPPITRIEFSGDPAGPVKTETIPEKVDPGRINRLKPLYTKLGIEVIGVAAPDHDDKFGVQFVNFRHGFVFSGASKGIAYESNPDFMKNRPWLFLSQDCLDKYTSARDSPGHRQLSSDKTAYCEIAPHWYLYLSVEN